MVDILKVSLVTRNNSFFHMTWKYFNISKMACWVIIIAIMGFFFLVSMKLYFIAYANYLCNLSSKKMAADFSTMVRKKLCGL